MTGDRCEATVYPQQMSFPRRHQCSRKGVVERNGKFYCKQHDPVAVKERKEKREAKYEKQWEDHRLQCESAQKRAQYFDKLIEALRDLERAETKYRFSQQVFGDASSKTIERRNQLAQSGDRARALLREIEGTQEDT